MSDYNFNVNRRALYEQLGFKGETIPKGASFERVMQIPHRRFRVDGNYLPGGPYLVRVKPNVPGSYAKHRIFVVCGCGKEVAISRLQQHIVACKCEQMQTIRQCAGG